MGQRLLIVDSDRRFLQDHQAALESTFEVDVLNTTEAALGRLESGAYAAILLCVEVSENKGYALCSAIRRAPALQELRVVLISAKATEEEYARHQSLKGKADLYLHKPIPTHALIAALTPIVPVKIEDPDNPLGDIGGADLGDEWLDSLKSELEAEVAPRTDFALAPQPSPAGVPAATFLLPPLPLSHQATQKLTAIPRDAGRVELLEARVRDLEAKLVAKSDDLDRSLRDLEDLRHSHNATTRNLDDLEQRQAQAQLLQAKLQESQWALEAQAAQSDGAARGLQEDLKAALAEQDRLREVNEAATAQLTAMTQQTMESMEANQLLQAQLEEARDNAALHLQAQRTLVETQDKHDQLQARLDQQEAEHRNLQERHAQQEAEHQSLEERYAQQEAEHRSLEERYAQQEAEHQSLVERYAQQEASAQRLETECDECRTTRTSLESAFSELERQVATMDANHKQQQLELLAGIDEREALLGRLNATIDAQREQALLMEQQRIGLENQVRAGADRMRSLHELLEEVEGKTSQALHLVKAGTS